MGKNPPKAREARCRPTLPAAIVTGLLQGAVGAKMRWCGIEGPQLSAPATKSQGVMMLIGLSLGRPCSVTSRPLSLIAIFDLHSSLVWGAAWLIILIIIQL
jgi:hypothetical protein